MTGHRARGRNGLTGAVAAVAVAWSGQALAQEPAPQPPAAEKPKPGLVETIGGALGGALASSAATASGGPVAGAAGGLAGQKVGRGIGGFLQRLFGGKPKPEAVQAAQPEPAAQLEPPALAEAADKAQPVEVATEAASDAAAVTPPEDPEGEPAI